MATNAIMAMLKNSVAKYLIDLCTIERAVTAIDEYGGSVQTWVTVAADAHCRIITAGQANASTTAVTGNQESLRAEYKIAVSTDVALGVDYRVTVGTDVYDVVRLETALTDEAFHQAVIVKRA